MTCPPSIAIEITEELKLSVSQCFRQFLQSQKKNHLIHHTSYFEQMPNHFQEEIKSLFGNSFSERLFHALVFRLCENFLENDSVVQSRSNAFLRKQIAIAEGMAFGRCISQTAAAAEEDTQFLEQSCMEEFTENPTLNSASGILFPTLSSNEIPTVFVMNEKTNAVLEIFLADQFKGLKFLDYNSLSEDERSSLIEVWEFFGPDVSVSVSGLQSLSPITRDNLREGFINWARHFILRDKICQSQVRKFLAQTLRRAGEMVVSSAAAATKLAEEDEQGAAAASPAEADATRRDPEASPPRGDGSRSEDSPGQRIVSVRPVTRHSELTIGSIVLFTVGRTATYMVYMGPSPNHRCMLAFADRDELPDWAIQQGLRSTDVVAADISLVFLPISEQSSSVLDSPPRRQGQGARPRTRHTDAAVTAVGDGAAVGGPSSTSSSPYSSLPNSPLPPSREDADGDYQALGTDAYEGKFDRYMGIETRPQGSVGLGNSLGDFRTDEEFARILALSAEGATPSETPTPTPPDTPPSQINYSSFPRRYTADGRAVKPAPLDLSQLERRATAEAPLSGYEFDDEGFADARSSAAVAPAPPSPDSASSTTRPGVGTGVGTGTDTRFDDYRYSHSVGVGVGREWAGNSRSRVLGRRFDVYGEDADVDSEDCAFDDDEILDFPGHWEGEGEGEGEDDGPYGRDVPVVKAEPKALGRGGLGLGEERGRGRGRPPAVEVPGVLKPLSFGMGAGVTDLGFGATGIESSWKVPPPPPLSPPDDMPALVDDIPPASAPAPSVSPPPSPVRGPPPPPTPVVGVTAEEHEVLCALAETLGPSFRMGEAQMQCVSSGGYVCNNYTLFLTVQGYRYVWDFDKRDYGIKFDPFFADAFFVDCSPATRARLPELRRSAAARESNRCFYLTLGVALRIHPFALQCMFRESAAKILLTPGDERSDFFGECLRPDPDPDIWNSQPGLLCRGGRPLPPPPAPTGGGAGDGVGEAPKGSGGGESASCGGGGDAAAESDTATCPLPAPAPAGDSASPLTDASAGCGGGADGSADGDGRVRYGPVLCPAHNGCFVDAMSLMAVYPVEMDGCRVLVCSLDEDGLLEHYTLFEPAAAHPHGPRDPEGAWTGKDIILTSQFGHFNLLVPRKATDPCPITQILHVATLFARQRQGRIEPLVYPLHLPPAPPLPEEGDGEKAGEGPEAGAESAKEERGGSEGAVGRFRVYGVGLGGPSPIPVFVPAPPPTPPPAPSPPTTESGQQGGDAVDIDPLSTNGDGERAEGEGAEGLIEEVCAQREPQREPQRELQGELLGEGSEGREEDPQKEGKGEIEDEDWVDLVDDLRDLGLGLGAEQGEGKGADA